MIFVFGSNEGGYHGAGAARYAREKKGAQMGVAFGMTGNSFAIPTKDKTIKNTLHLQVIKVYVHAFLWEATTMHTDKEFQVTRIGCGLAGLKDEDIAPMFINAPWHCQFDEAWKPFLGDKYKYWGSF